MPFRALGLGPAILHAVQDAGYTEPTPVQLKAIPVILKGHDAIGIAQTGTGKTAAFVLPILERLAAHPAPKSTRVLVLVPTRELAAQVEENVRKYARHVPVRCAPVFGGVNESPQIKALQSHVDIVVATPGRLLDLMGRFGNPFKQLEVLVLDEADRMLDMGFLPDMRRILKQLPTRRQTLLFSATLSKEIEDVAREFLTRPEVIQVGRRSAPTHTVTQLVYEVPKSRKVPLLLHLLKDEGLDCVLVFSRTKRGADKLAKRLAAENISTSALHSNRSQSQRQASLRGFKSGQYRVLVATDIAARGIDVDGISHVVNFDFPAAPEDYVHRIGRTGRAQAIGDALSFVTSEDHEALRDLERFIGRGIPRRTVEGLKDDQPPARPA
ncbi:MAG TPA: DEAD/DEAH box helicase, partial [Candidatus Saccharimonadales bacterium]|nr:DEAD/DEAH box helicase [Candidatus Saccharimonadales bacterium]